MIAVDRDAGMAASFVTGTKECDAYVVRRLTNFVDRLHEAGRIELWSDTESVQIAASNNNPQSLEVRSETGDGGGLVSLRSALALLCAALASEIGGTGSLGKA